MCMTKVKYVLYIFCMIDYALAFWIYIIYKRPCGGTCIQQYIFSINQYRYSQESEWVEI